MYNRALTNNGHIRQPIADVCDPREIYCITVYYNRMAYLLAVFCFVLLLFTVFVCMYVFLFLFFATTSLVNKDLYI